jgi:hypothetical protein
MRVRGAEDGPGDKEAVGDTGESGTESGSTWGSTSRGAVRGAGLDAVAAAACTNAAEAEPPPECGGFAGADM